MYLEQKLDKADLREKEILIASLKTRSPISWAHVNLL